MKTTLKKLRTAIYELFGSSKYSRLSINNLDKKLEKYLNYNNGFFIEAGANNGYSQSNTYYLEKFLGWKGILVEGIPDLYEQCKKERKFSSVYNCALVSNKFKENFIEMHYANLMSMVEGSMKNQEDQENQLKKGLNVQKISNTYTIKAPARTLESILDEYVDLPPIDFFSLDVEGYELNVLKGLNLDKYRPKYILVEARFFEEVDSYLNPYYELIEKLTHHDYLYCVRELTD